MAARTFARICQGEQSAASNITFTCPPWESRKPSRPPPRTVPFGDNVPSSTGKLSCPASPFHETCPQLNARPLGPLYPELLELPGLA